MLGIILLALLLRILFLGADPPWDMTFSQGILTDPFWYTDTAISWAKRIPADLAHTSFNQPIFTGWAYFIFRIFGVGWSQMNFISVIPGVLSVLFVGLLFRKTREKKAVWLCSLFLGINCFFIFYNRIPKVYSLLTLFVVFCMWLWQKGFEKRLYYFASLILILITALYLKVLAIILLPIFLILRPPLSFSRRKILVWSLAAGFALFAIVVGMKIYPLVLDKLIAYRLKGEMLGSVMVRMPFSNWSYIYKTMLPEILLALSYPLFMLYRQTGKTAVGRKTDLAVVSIVIVTNLLFFTFQYYPPRFYLFLIPFLCYLATGSVFELLEPSPPIQDLKTPSPFGRLRPLLVSVWVFFLLWHIACAVATEALLIHVSPVAILLGGLSLLLGFLLHTKVFLKMTLRCRSGLVAMLILCVLIGQGFRYTAWAVTRKYSTKIAIAEAPYLIPPEAIVGGPYAHLLGLRATFQKPWVQLRHLTTASLVHELRAKQVTHLALDVTYSLERIQRLHADLLPSLLPTASFFIRGYEIRLYRFLPADQLSPLEMAAAAIAREDNGEARLLLSRLPPSQQEISQIRYWQAMLKGEEGRYEEAVQDLKDLVEVNPYFAPAWGDLARYYLDQGEKEAAGQYRLRALESSQRTPAVFEIFLKEFK